MTHASGWLARCSRTRSTACPRARAPTWPRYARAAAAGWAVSTSRSGPSRPCSTVSTNQPWRLAVVRRGTQMIDRLGGESACAGGEGLADRLVDVLVAEELLDGLGFEGVLVVGGDQAREVVHVGLVHDLPHQPHGWRCVRAGWRRPGGALRGLRRARALPGNGPGRRGAPARRPPWRGPRAGRHRGPEQGACCTVSWPPRSHTRATEKWRAPSLAHHPQECRTSSGSPLVISGLRRNRSSVARSSVRSAASRGTSSARPGVRGTPEAIARRRERVAFWLRYTAALTVGSSHSVSLAADRICRG